MEQHNMKPIYDQNSKILILGSFPSVKSREVQFFYSHSQNRFWKILEELLEVKLETIEDKRNILFQKNIALWDVINLCEIKGSSDSSIKNVQPNDISSIINNSKIKYIFTNGKKSYELYNKYCLNKTNIKAIYLPSTSPANATYSLEKLIKEWKIILEYL